jgi:hypothetical protein
MKAVRTALIVTACLAACHAAGAQASSRVSVPAIDPQISQLTSGGYWESGGKAGSYRAVELMSGYEHIRRRVVLQWLLQPSDDDDARVVASVDLATYADNVYSVSDPKLDFSGGWTLAVRTTSRPDAQPDGALRFKLGAPKKLQVLKQP